MNLLTTSLRWSVPLLRNLRLGRWIGGGKYIKIIIKLTFIHQISQVRWNGEVHESQAVKGGLVIDGKTIECVLRRYELVDLEIVFSENYHP